MAGWLARLPRIAAAAVLVFVMLVGGTRLYAARAVAAPAQTALESLAFVTAAQVDSGAGARRVTVTLGAVPHLREAYLEVDRIARRTLGPADAAVEIVDRRDEALVDAYYRLRPYALEAAETGRHTAMAAAFSAEAAAMGLDPASRFVVDAERIYIQLHRGDAYLYAVERRAGGGDGRAD